MRTRIHDHHIVKGAQSMYIYVRTYLMFIVRLIVIHGDDNVYMIDKHRDAIRIDDSGVSCYFPSKKFEFSD